MHLDEKGLTSLWSKIRNYMLKKLNLKADKENTYTKNEVLSQIYDVTGDLMRGEVIEDVYYDSGITIRRLMFAFYPVYMARQEVMYSEGLEISFPTNVDRNDVPIFILCTLSDCGKNPWKGGPYTYSIQRRGTGNTFLISIAGASEAGHLVDKIQVSLLWWYI